MANPLSDRQLGGLFAVWVSSLVVLAAVDVGIRGVAAALGGTGIGILIGYLYTTQWVAG